MSCEVINVLARCHAAIADQHDAFEPKALFQIAHHLGNRLGVAPITLKHMMGDWPTVDHDQANQHLHVAWLAIAAEAVGA